MNSILGTLSTAPEYFFSGLKFPSQYQRVTIAHNDTPTRNLLGAVGQPFLFVSVGRRNDYIHPLLNLLAAILGLVRSPQRHDWLALPLP